MSFQRGPQRRLLILVVVDFPVESPAEQPAQDGDQVDGNSAPSGGELVEHFSGLLEGGTRDLLQASAKSRRRQNLRPYQPRRLVMRPKDSVFGAFHGQQRPTGDEMREVTRVLADSGVAPLLTKFRHLSRFASHHL